MRTSSVPASRTRPVARRWKVADWGVRAALGPAISVMRGLLSSAHELVGHDAAVAQLDDRAVDDALAVRAAGVDAERRADLGDGPRLVDVAVQAEHRVVALDQRPDRARAD